MRIFKCLFGSKKLKSMDSDFGEIESFRKIGNNICWQMNKRYLNSDIQILIPGNKKGIAKNQKQILIDAFNNEAKVRSESEKALKEQFENAEMKFISIKKHFELIGLTVHDEGFEMTFQEKEGQNYFFNIHFKNNKQIGVSIDG